MYAKVYCVGRDKKNYGLSFPLEIVKTEELQEDNSKRSSSRRTWGTKPPEAGPQRAGLEKSRNICFENIAKNKSWLNKGSETPCKPPSEAFVMTAEKPQKQRACQPFWRTVNFDALFQMKARTNFSHRITIKSRWQNIFGLPMEFRKQFLVRMLLAF